MSLSLSVFTPAKIDMTWSQKTMMLAKKSSAKGKVSRKDCLRKRETKATSKAKAKVTKARVKEPTKSSQKGRKGTVDSNSIAVSSPLVLAKMKRGRKMTDPKVYEIKSA